jgi:hypothetical protein
MGTADEFAPAIRRLQADIQSKEAEIIGLKKTVNTLCGYAGQPALYQVADMERSADITQLRRDQFYGVPLASAVKDYLRMRGDPKSGGSGAATVNEIFGALKAGGFHFDTKVDDNAKRNLRISLSKNVTAFHRVPGDGDGAYGLTDWYPAAKAVRPANGGKQADLEPEEEQGPPISSDVSDTYHSDDASEP